jgi:hypothetical protein
MKTILILCTLFTSSFTILAQDYDDLLVLFADGNYEKLVKVADSYTQKEKTKKDPEPYYWLAKGLFAMSKDAEYTSQEKYKNAYKDAIGAVSKFVKLDKDGSKYEEYRAFFSEFKMSMVEVIENEIASGNYSKAAGWIIKIPKIDPNDFAYLYVEGACKYRKGDKAGASTCWKAADEKLNALTSIDDWREEDIKMLALGLMETAECYLDSKRIESAKEVMNKGFKWLEDNEAFKSKYDEIVN